MGERLEWLDRVRGLALLALIPVSMRWWMHPRDTKLHPWLADSVDGLAWAWWVATDGLLHGTPVIVLGLVCGYALALHDDRHAAAGTPHGQRLARQVARTAGLITIGTLVGTLLWAGELLTVTGIVLLACWEPRGVRQALDPRIWSAAILAGALLPAVGEVLLWSLTPADQQAAWRWGTADPGYLSWEETKFLASWSDGQEVRMAQWRTAWGAGPGAFAALTPLATLATVWGAIQGGVWFERRDPGWNAWTDPALGLVGLMLTFGAAALTALAGFGGPAVVAAQVMTQAGAFGLAVFAFTAAAYDRSGPWVRSAAAAPAGAIGRAPVTVYIVTTAAAIALSHSWGGQLHGRLPHEGMMLLSGMMAAAWWFAAGKLDAAHRWLPEQSMLRRAEDIAERGAGYVGDYIGRLTGRDAATGNQAAEAEGTPDETAGTGGRRE